jgi:hypothetical protein
MPAIAVPDSATRGYLRSFNLGSICVTTDRTVMLARDIARVGNCGSRLVGHAGNGGRHQEAARPERQHRRARRCGILTRQHHRTRRCRRACKELCGEDQSSMAAVSDRERRTGPWRQVKHRSAKAKPPRSGGREECQAILPMRGRQACRRSERWRAFGRARTEEVWRCAGRFERAVTMVDRCVMRSDFRGLHDFQQI